MLEQSTLLSVSELTRSIKNRLEKDFSTISVQGEISNLKPHSSGHLYFDLKDEQAKIPAVMFKPMTSSLRRLPKEGDHVKVQGSLSVYAPHGRYQLLVKELVFEGVGELLLKLEQLKKKLQTLGWFDQTVKKPLPSFPKTIGVVTSPTGAVIQDIIHVLSRRCPGFHLILNPVKVQGAGAAEEIAQAIAQFNRYNLADVLIVGRGGGSLEDLWAFNEEKVAEAIFQSKIPIISAVGHETDVTIADFVADFRAPTPSAAAEIVCKETISSLEFLKKVERGCYFSLQQQTKSVKMKMQSLQKHPLFSSPYHLLSQPMQKLDEIKEKLEDKVKYFLQHEKMKLSIKTKEVQSFNPLNQLRLARQKTIYFAKQFGSLFQSSAKLHHQRLLKISTSLAALDPKNVLKRGYSILFSQKRDSVIVSTQQLPKDETVRALLSDGEAFLKVVDSK